MTSATACGAMFGMMVGLALFGIAFQWTGFAIPWPVFWKGAAIGFGMVSGFVLGLVALVWTIAP